MKTEDTSVQEKHAMRCSHSVTSSDKWSLCDLDALYFHFYPAKKGRFSAAIGQRYLPQPVPVPLFGRRLANRCAEKR